MRAPKSLYEKIYCARGQAENLIKAHKLHLPYLLHQSERQPVPATDSHRRVLADAHPARTGAENIVLA